MNLRDLARSRRSVRRFRAGPVSDDAIRRIVDAGRLAPSGANHQPWRFVVVDDPGTKRRSIEEIAFRNRFGAPL